ncbi:MAG: hypothetical protein AAF511_07745 [Pseudomonadota bacterium]
MPLFDAYVMTDWSAASTPTRPRAANTIWTAHWEKGASGVENFTTRRAAMMALSRRFTCLLAKGSRVFAGFDFSFGYPAGAAQAITGQARWESLWAYFAREVSDDEKNANNRFDIADRLNAQVFAKQPKFWGRPPGRTDLKSLPAKKNVTYGDVAEHRIAERYFPRAQPVWKMFTTGSVGGQSMTGIAQLEILRQDPALKNHLVVWPFDTGFDQGLPHRPSITLAELYPSAFTVEPQTGEVLDEAQVRSVVDALVSRDQADVLRPLLAPPPDAAPEQQALMIAEEGSIIGAGLLNVQGTSSR